MFGATGRVLRCEVQRGLSANLAFSSRSRANLAFSSCSPPCLATRRRLRALMPGVRQGRFRLCSWREHDRRRPPGVERGEATSPSSCAPRPRGCRGIGHGAGSVRCCRVSPAAGSEGHGATKPGACAQRTLSMQNTSVKLWAQQVPEPR